MTNAQRIRNVISGLFIIIAGIAVMISGEKAAAFVSLFIGVFLLLKGIKNISFYVSMARHMVGGKTSLISGIILVDLGLFAMSLNRMSLVYLILYLLGTHAFKGIVDMMMAIESKKSGASSWKFNFFIGFGNLALAIIAAIYGFAMKSADVVMIIYGLGIVNVGFSRLVNAFRRTTIVYIQ